MKKLWQKLLVSVLSLSMIVSMAAVSAFAVETDSTNPIVIDVEKSGFDENAGAFNLYLKIDKTASGDLTVDLSSAVGVLLDEYAKQYGYNSYPVLPGDSNRINIYISNDSDKTYYYEKSSLKLAPGDVSGMSEEQLSPFTGFDGQRLPLTHIGVISNTNKAIYKELFGVSGSASITADMMFSIYDYLAVKGYTGDDALTNYLLDYYCDYYSTDYASWDELVAAQPSLGDTFAVAGHNSIFEMSYSNMEEYCAEHPELAPFVYYESDVENPSGSDAVKVQIKWPEEKLATFSYNSFYKDYFSIAFGEEEIVQLNPNSNTGFTRTRGVGDYMDIGSALYQQTDSYLTGLENADSLANGDTIAFPMMLAVDGPGVGNGYMNYSFFYQNSIILKQVVEEEIPDEEPPLEPPVEEPDPEEPPVEEPEDPPVDLPDEDVPLAPPEQPIEPEQPEVEITDEEIPLEAPKTGDIFATAAASVVFGLTGVVVLGGLILRLRKNHDQ